jgi:TolA-binding protein
MSSLLSDGRPGKMVGLILAAAAAAAMTLAGTVPAAAEISLETAVQLYRNGQFREAHDQFAALLERTPESAEVLFYLAELEPNADQALSYRQRFLSLHPDHQRADEVLYGIAQYHFAVGYYLTAAKDYQRLLHDYSGSPLRPDALYWLASSKLAIGAADSAEVYFQRLIQDHPGSSLVSWARLGLIDALYINQEYAQARQRSQELLQTPDAGDLIPLILFRQSEIREALGDRTAAAEILRRLVEEYSGTYQGNQARRQLTEWGWDESGQQAEPQPAEGNYTIQVGAFSKRANALNLQSKLQSWGYQVEMIKRAGRHRTLYLIWVGRYQTRSSALEEAERLERDRGLPYQVIRR